jgi:hypothetical protein
MIDPSLPRNNREACLAVLDARHPECLRIRDLAVCNRAGCVPLILDMTLAELGVGDEPRL